MTPMPSLSSLSLCCRCCSPLFLSPSSRGHPPCFLHHCCFPLLPFSPSSVLPLWSSTIILEKHDCLLLSSSLFFLCSSSARFHPYPPTSMPLLPLASSILFSNPDASLPHHRRGVRRLSANPQPWPLLLSTVHHRLDLLLNLLSVDLCASPLPSLAIGDSSLVADYPIRAQHRPSSVPLSHRPPSLPPPPSSPPLPAPR